MKRIFSLALVLVMMFTLLFMVSAQGTETNEYLQEMQGVGELVGIAPMTLGAFRGHVDFSDGRLTRGWFWRPSHPNRALTIRISVYDSNNWIRAWTRTVVANQFRADLPVGTGRYGFNLQHEKAASLEILGQGPRPLRLVVYVIDPADNNRTEVALSEEWRSPFIGTSHTRTMGWGMNNAAIDFRSVQALTGSWRMTFEEAFSVFNAAMVGTGVPFRATQDLSGNHVSVMARGPTAAFGFIRFPVTNGEIRSYQIEINSSRAAAHSNTAVSVINHELSHLFFLADNPSLPARMGVHYHSVMSGNRDRNRIFRPQATDINAMLVAHRHRARLLEPWH